MIGNKIMNRSEQMRSRKRTVPIVSYREFVRAGETILFIENCKIVTNMFYDTIKITNVFHTIVLSED